MPSSLPAAADILAVIREFIEADILPNLSDDKRFNARVAVNLLATIERELRFGPAADADEAARLNALAGPAGSIVEKNRRLARAIRDGLVSADDPQLLDYLRSTLGNALQINNPKWIGA